MESKKFYQTTKFRIAAGATGFLLAYILLARLDGIWFDLWDIVILLVALPFWIFFFAQFILPVRRFADRMRIFEHLQLYALGAHGPAVIVENGIIRQREGEQRRRGPGIIWLDTASAAVLRTPTFFTRTVGPGVVFNHHHEYIAATVDLHNQTQTMGPRDTEDNDDPFKAAKDHPDYGDIQKRRWETSAMTRDGIEIVASISINFGINSPPDSYKNPQTPFGYSDQNVYNFVRNNVTSEIIGRMVVDIWREYVRRFKLSQLFEAPETDTTKTVLQTIIGMVNARLGYTKVNEMDEFGRLTKREVDSLEYLQIQAMGVKVNASFRRLWFEPDVEQKLIGAWTTNWLKSAEKEHDQVERQRALRMRMGHESALQEFANSASQEIGVQFPHNRSEALELLLHGTLRGSLRSATLQRRMTSEANELSDLIQWLRENSGGGDVVG
jgi:hypothetical protein